MMRAMPRGSPWSTLFTDALRAALDGTPFGMTKPAKTPPDNPDVDGRTHALRALRAYIMEIIFQIPDPPRRGSRPFQLEKDRVLIEWPDGMENLLFPRVEFAPGEMTYKPFGLTPVVFEETRDRFGPGTVVVCGEEHFEQLEVQAWATTRSQRRALIAGLETMLFTPLEEVSGLRLRMPQYYGETVSFQPSARANRDDEDSGKRRRMASLTLEMSFNVVRLVRYAELVPGGAQTEVDTVVRSEPLPILPRQRRMPR